MYHCNIRFYMVGFKDRGIKEIIKSMPPMENFFHNYTESDTADKVITAESDVIFAYINDKNAHEALSLLTQYKSKEAELILFTDTADISCIEEYFDCIKDLWRLPMSESEIRFRFLRWQLNYKESKDYWEISQFFEAAINNTPNLLWFKSKTGIHERVNNSFCRTVNKTRKQVEGRGHAYIWDVEHDDPACIESEMEVMRTGTTFTSEETVKTGNGTMLLTTYKSPLYDIDGSVMGTVGIGIDITQERKYELDLEGKNLTLETLFTSLDCGIMIHSLDGTSIISINSAALKILGYSSKEELLEAGFRMIAPSVMDEDKPKLRESIQKLEKEGDSIGVEYRVQHANGDILHIMGNVKMVKQDGELYYRRFLLDNTANKLKEDKAREETEKRHAELVNALGVDFNLVCYFNLESEKGNILRIEDTHNHDLDEIFGKNLSLKDSMDIYISRFVHDDDKELMRMSVDPDRIKSVLSDKKLFHVNYRTYKDRAAIYYQMKVVRIGSWQNGSKDIVVGFRSVDDEVRSDMEQKALLENALMQANRANKAKSVFLSNMSHDIRTPMNAIVGFTTLAINHIDRKEQVQEYLKKIMTSGNHMLSLINDVLDMSRIESGKMHLDEKHCSLPEILHGLRNILHADIAAKQLELYIDAVDIFDEEICCDKLRLNQVLLNLLSNSVKYTPAGGTISMRITEKPGAPEGSANYEFIVKDTGIGMSKEFVAHIFDPFERERNSTISGIQGTGLGMAITKNIVDMMNGTIDVTSEQGKGTEVVVCFTFRVDPEKKLSPMIEELKNCRALVVDDDFNTCDSVSGMLQQIGMRADWTLSGKEAVLRTRQAVSRSDNYGVYIIDWLMPDMNGVEVTRRIRKETGENVPIIVITAYDWTDIEDEAKEAGVTAFCAKPLFLSELSSCLRSVVNTDQIEEKKDCQDKKIRSGRILLTEDNPLNQEIAVAILTEAGFTVDVADNGKIAVDILAKAEEGYYRTVLMDVQMPVMNGYEAARSIRKLKNKNSEIPIIAMTANAFEEDKQEALRSGMNGHIAKPIDMKKLFETLDTIIA